MSQVEKNLVEMYKNLLLVKENAKLCGFSYEVEDSINELLTFCEFDMDERGIGYGERE